MASAGVTVARPKIHETVRASMVLPEVLRRVAISRVIWLPVDWVPSMWSPERQ